MTETVNILLVDDEPGMLRYIRTLLEVDDYTVQTASTGEEALQQVEKGLRPDLVLLDLLMPGIDGLQTLEQLRQLVPGLKVVMLSCVSDTRKVVQAIRLGAHDYLTKPFQKAELDDGHRSVSGKEPAELARRSRRALRRRIFRGRKSGDAQDSLAGGAGRQRRYSRPDAGRERYRQGSRGPADSQAVAARAPHFPESELRRRARRLAGKRIVRPRSWRLHRRYSCQAGQIRALQQRHDPARRNWRNARPAASQTAARFAGPDVLAPGQPLGDQGGRPHPGRDQHQYSRGAGQQASARRSLLPSERLHPAAAAAARTQGRNSRFC